MKIKPDTLFLLGLVLVGVVIVIGIVLGDDHTNEVKLPHSNCRVVETEHNKVFGSDYVTREKWCLTDRTVSAR